jgi:DinB superfamily
MKNAYLPAMADQLRHISLRVTQHFGPLSAHQLNWKPDPKSWSIGQCLDHIITSNTTYFPVFRAIQAEQAKVGWWTRISPFTDFFGNMLLRDTGPQVRRRMKSPRAFAPQLSQVDPAILIRFQKHQQELMTLILGTDNVLHSAVKIPSPAAGVITYRLDHAVKIIVQHEERHLLQAVRVMEHPSFPQD